MSEIEAEKLWKKIFPPECYGNFWGMACLERMPKHSISHAWEIFTQCEHAQGCMLLRGVPFEVVKLALEQVEKNRIQNLKIAQRRVPR